MPVRPARASLMPSQEYRASGEAFVIGGIRAEMIFNGAAGGSKIIGPLRVLLQRIR